ncbi:MAG: Do family serine endopeptidase, partial [bacterium]
MIRSSPFRPSAWPLSGPFSGFVAMLLALTFLLPAAPAGAQVVLPDFADLVDRQGGAVVNISTTQTVRGGGRGLPQFPNIPEDDPFFEFFRRFLPPNPGAPGPRDLETRSLGSGFIISADGFILTNAHVVEGADDITVRLTDKRDFKAKLIGSDRRTDIALLKIEATGLPRVNLGDPNRLRVGEWVVAIGSPFGFDNSVTAGIVSAKGRALPQENFVPFIQTDVAINPGNSGGPLLNLAGEVVGINSQIYSQSGGYMGLSFAIPIDLAMDVESQLVRHGRVARGRLGIAVQSLDQTLAQSFKLDSPRGALVNQVEPDMPAARAGLEPGDVILAVDGEPVDDSAVLSRLIAARKPGERVKLALQRAGEKRQIEVSLAEAPGAAVAAADEARGAEDGRLGVVVSALPAGAGGRGVLVEAVSGAAARAGIRAGDMILAVGATPVASPADLASLGASAPAR